MSIAWTTPSGLAGLVDRGEPLRLEPSEPCRPASRVTQT